MDKSDSYLRIQESRRLKLLFMGLFLIIIVSLVYIFRYYAWPFLFAIILYIAIKPFHDRLASRLKMRTITTTLVIIFIFLLIIIPVFYLFFILADQVYQLYNILQLKVESGILKQLENVESINRFMDYFQIQGDDVIIKLTQFLEKSVISVFQSLTKIVSFPITFIINLFFMVLMLFFLLKDGHRLDQGIYKILPFPDDLEKDVVNRLKEVIKVLLAGNILIMFMQGTALGIGFFIAGIGMSQLWGSIAAILSLIPAIGTMFLWVPAVIYLIITGNYISSIFLGIWCLLWYQLLENLVKPKFFGAKLRFHPVIFFFLLLGSIQAFGLPGVIVGPLLLTLFYSFWNIYKLLDEYDTWKKAEKTETGEE
jgi:predicted PurR-regulated permease PerM